jgi:hypothetical protein
MHSVTHEFIRQQDGKRFIANDHTGTPHSMTKSAWRILVHDRHLHIGTDRTQSVGEIGSPTRAHPRHDISIRSCVGSDCWLCHARHDDDVVHSRRHRLIHHQLKGRDIHDGEKFLWNRFRDREKTRPEASGRNHGGTYIHELSR